jgi:tRNA(Ile)-lysidine synthase
MAASRSSGSPEYPDGGPVAAALGAAIDALPATARLTVAYSGGLDSTVLLHTAALACRGSSRRLQAIHVHHGINAQAEFWAEHCRRFCVALGVELLIHRVSLAPEAIASSGLEAAARELRYAAFASLDTDVLLLAHHRDDQAETLLLNLVRGCGPSGAAAMPAERLLSARGPAIRLLRPLLHYSRAMLADYAGTQDLGWIDDDSNANLALARNRIRHAVLPELERMRPGAAGNLAAAGRRFAESLDLLDDLADLDLRAALEADPASLAWAALAELPSRRRRNALRRWLTRAGVRLPGEARLRELETQAAKAGENSRLRVDFGNGHTVRGWRGALFVAGDDRAAPAAMPLRLAEGSVARWGSGRLTLIRCEGGGISRAALADVEVVELRPRSGGERFQPSSRRPRRTLQDCLSMAGIPPWERASLPLLWHGGSLLWVAGLGVDCSVAAGPGGAGWLPVWEPDAET